ncbi:dTDP-4-amino-4,6-dideoxygalactose transaminase [Cellulomonas hominis]|uniref:dTDP-4-amino-4,6-dideoxygalactose transaminase n=1 Tax=Cellulomonas hominis TaxID=156981 RepID=UPI001B917F56|nr:dTDP-4-amino-4,6-dideoxygalactose transaminase [Cellulomonas hominis]VTR76202.1 dTDP-4-amino-4,6-dideoxygalactose transaminase [Cellulomonas hominis]
MSDVWIPFSKPFRAPGELAYLDQVLESGHTHGDGPFTARAARLVESVTGAQHSLLTGSGTHALELASWLLDLEPGDEVVVPSFTFSTTAASVIMTGATPVFVDIDPATGSMDVDSFAAAITPRTRAVYVVHYGGVAPDMRRVLEVADAAGVAVVEDNAHGLGARWDGQGCGTFGVLAAQSFHATKNIQCGEGGALLVNDARLRPRAEVLREKGTDRSRFLRGEVDKYSWIDRGSSYLPSELTAAILTAQLEAFDTIQGERHSIWDFYARELADWADTIGATLMSPPARSEHPAHVFWLLTPDAASRDGLLAHLRASGVGATFHYIPLHSSVAGRRFGRTPGPCTATDDFSERLVRLPLWAGMGSAAAERVRDAVLDFRPVAV